jgi:hypothetical protein
MRINKEKSSDTRRDRVFIPPTIAKLGGTYNNGRPSYLAVSFPCAMLSFCFPLQTIKALVLFCFFFPFYSFAFALLIAQWCSIVVDESSFSRTLLTRK